MDDLLNLDPDPSLPIPARAGDAARAAQPQPKPKSQPPDFLGIDPQRLVEITEQACLRIDDCRAEMGLRFGQPIAGEGTWAWDRQCARIMYQGNMEHRKALGGIFLDNNWSLNIPSRIVRMLAAQHSGDLVGSDPFCAVMPEACDDPADAKLAKQTEKLVQDEISDSAMRQVLAESIRVALTEGERPIKVTYDLDQTQFVGDAVVMVRPTQAAEDNSGPGPEEGDASDGTQDASAAADQTPVASSKVVPVKTPSGDYIFPKDEFLRFYVDAAGKCLGVVKDDPTTPDPTAPPPQAPPGAVGIQLRLKKEPAFVLQGQPVYRLVKNLTQTITHHRGLNVAGLFCEDFLYPTKCPSLRDPACDIMVHCYDEPLDSMTARYRNAGYAEQYLPLRETGALSQASQPNWEAGESYQGSSRRMVNVHETYFRVRVNEDDQCESWIFLVIDYSQRLPVYAEYLGNLKMKRPPFVLLRGVESEPGRAYGVGVYKKFADKNLAIDVWFNRAALKSSKTGSLTFQHEDGWKAEYQGQQLTIGGTEVYKIPASSSDQYGPSHPPVFRVNLNEMSDKEFELMEKLIQDGDLSFGVVNAADGASAALNASGTATGVRNIERTGNILQRATEELMATDIEEVLELVADTVLENLDEESAEWVPGEDQLATLNREEIRNLPRDVRVLLTKAKGEESLATNQQASQIVQDYYSKPLSLRKKVRSFVIGQLKSLFIPDADQVIEDPTDDQIAQEAQSTATPPKASETLAIALKDIGPLSPDERAQALKLFGITASPPSAQQQPATGAPLSALPSPDDSSAPPSAPHATATPAQPQLATA